jgi:hypothetical protein
MAVRLPLTLGDHGPDGPPASRTTVSAVPVTATFVPPSISLVPLAETSVHLRIHNDEPVPQLIQLTPSGDLAEQLKLSVTSVALEAGEIFDVPVVIDGTTALPPGNHSPTVEVVARSGDVTAVAAVEVPEHAAHTATLRPERSSGSSAGRHVVDIVNSGNVAVIVDLVPELPEARVAMDLTSPVTVAAGEQRAIACRLSPAERFWTGPDREYPFTLRTSGTDGRTYELGGTYVQRSRVPAWLGPAAAGAAAALLISAIVWFAVLRPWVHDTVDDAIEADRAALQERIAELDAAAAEARELPLGAPTDLRLEVSAGSGATGADMQEIDAGMRLSVTDVVFQNATGAVGTVSLRRDGDVLLQSELANFRDLDLHFVAPFTFDERSEISLEVDCRTPGPGESDCLVGATIVGFIDEID